MGIVFVAMGTGFHATNPQAAVYWNPANAQTGDFTVSAWFSQLARDLGIDTSILATRGDLEALLRSDPEARLANGWRAEALGDAVRSLVSGGAALAFDGKGGLVLEERSGTRFSGGS